MPKHGKKYREAAAQIETGRLYTPPEAIELVKKVSYTKFDGTVELHMRLGVDPRHADQIVRGTAVLPHGTGRTVRVLVFAQGERRARPRRPAPISSARRISCAHRGRLARLRRGRGHAGYDGPGRSPGPHARPARLDAEPQIGHRHLRRRHAPCRTSRPAASSSASTAPRCCTCRSARSRSSEQQLLDNLLTLVEAIVAAKPSGAKGTYIRTVYLAATMSPGMRLDPTAAQASHARGLATRRAQSHILTDAAVTLIARAPSLTSAQ